jgi:hypothetical protein
MPTTFFAKLMGFSLVLLALAMLATRQSTIETMNAFFADAPLMWITGVFTMMFGLTIVILHNRWSGGPLPIIVTLYGWIAVLKGASFIFFPPSAQAGFYQALHFDSFLTGYAIVALIIGAYLIYAAFTVSNLNERDRPPSRS